MQDQFKAALNSIRLDITKYRPDKQRPIVTNKGTMSVEKFSKYVLASLGASAIDFPEVFKATQDLKLMSDILETFAKENIKEVERVIEIPEDYKSLTLNVDDSHTGQRNKYFMTTEEEFVSHISGNVFISVCQLKEVEAASIARKVTPQYMPHKKRGISIKKDEMGLTQNVFNTYMPPAWTRYEGIDDLPDSLPKSFTKLVKHLFPVPEEREYFFSWLYHSLFKRSFVYLVLCGAPGTGKNRLKLVMRALHGHSNTIDGKKSTLVERFNSQLADATLAWFDELHYDLNMENLMKELQNDSISIERKGIDATRSTRIHASLVISNNKPRDNFIAFDARKFAPLQISNDRLEASMTAKEITEMTLKVEDWQNKNYDLAYIAQIGKWIKKHGKSDKWPQLEYRGPMFWMLAHTSMSRWQKKAAMTMLEAVANPPGRAIIDKEKGFLWSSLHDLSQKKNGDKSLQFPDFSTVKHFFDIFRDSDGNLAFKTSGVRKNIMGDFWVKSKFENVEIITEAQVIEAKAVKGKSNGEKEEEYYDL